jgi:hypothetical protein
MSLSTGSRDEREQSGDVPRVVNAPVVGARERKARHPQRPGHAELFGFSTPLGELRLEVGVVGAEGPHDAVVVTVLLELRAVVGSPRGEHDLGRSAVGVDARRESGHHLGEGRRGVHLGLGDRRELRAERRQPGVSYRADEGLELLKGFERGAVDKHGAHLDDLHLGAGHVAPVIAGRLDVDHEIAGRTGSTGHCFWRRLTRHGVFHAVLSSDKCVE